jgi:hypothetical protein
MPANSTSRPPRARNHEHVKAIVADLLARLVASPERASSLTHGVAQADRKPDASEAAPPRPAGQPPPR